MNDAETILLAITAFVALAGLILSQLPPLRELFRRNKVSLTLGESLGIDHYMGLVRLIPYLNLRNTGSNTIVIDRVGLVLQKLNDGSGGLSNTRKLLAQSFSWRYPGQSAEDIAFAPIILGPGEFWAASVTFNRLPDLEEEEKTERIRIDLSKDLHEKYVEARKTFIQQNETLEASPEIVARAIEQFNRRFDLTKGEYRLIIAAFGEDGKILVARQYRLVLYDSLIETMRLIADRYKHGWALVFAPPSHEFYQVMPRLQLDTSATDPVATYRSLTSSNPSSS